MTKTGKKIILFHYHLKKGGVTSVIREQVDALKDDHDILIVTGEPPEEFIHDDISVMPELGYSRITEHDVPPEESAKKILKAAERCFGAAADIMHFHNPILAKNHNLIKIIKLLSGSGAGIFLQIHDFAEDGRPYSYVRDTYPDDVHYGVINTRDYFHLLNSGLNEKGLHLIANCIRPLDCAESADEGSNLVLYPVRAIRRKNIGEAVLLSLFLNKRDYIGITLPALNNVDLKSYEDWKFFSKTKNLKVEFDLGVKYDFNELVKKSRFFITTSITEGFGFAYLESWRCGRGLFGRKLSDICNDFAVNGINLGGLYEKFLVPSELVDRVYCMDKIDRELENAEKYYGITVNREAFRRYFTGLLDGGHIDFGLLSEKMQAEVILKVMDNHAVKNRILASNGRLSVLTDTNFDKELIEGNARAVADSYSRESYKKHLDEIYDNVMGTKVKQKLDKSKLLSRFLQPEHFYLLKWGSYDG